MGEVIKMSVVSGELTGGARPGQYVERNVH